MASRWWLAFASCWLLFINHYARDITGALEHEIEAGFGVSKAEYGLLNSVYFVPNLVMPLIMGSFAQRLGPQLAVVVSVCVSAVGHLLVGIGVSSSTFSILLLGRLCLGLVYESIDMSPLPILAPRFKETWGLMQGLFNGFLRTGSVLNFFASPLLYQRVGLAAAMWVSSCLGLSGLVAVAVMGMLQQREPPQSSTPAADRDLLEASMIDLPGGEPNQEKHRQPLTGNEPTSSFGEPAGVSGFHRRFWGFVVTGLFMYSGIVPFWFFGSRYIQDHFQYSLDDADRLMLLPEGMIAIMAPLLGIYIDRARWSVGRRLYVLGAALLCFPISFALLLLPQVPPLATMLLMGAGWAWSNCLFWATTTRMMPPQLYPLGSGIIGSALNVGATILPYLMGHLSDTGSLALLLVVSSTASVAAVVTAGSLLDS